MAPLAFIAVFWIAPVLVAHKIGAPKNRAGWAWGLLLGWVGVIVVATLSDKHPKATAQDIALTAKQHEVKELETEIRLAELKAQRDVLNTTRT
jgi:hypothetical protein